MKCSFSFASKIEVYEQKRDEAGVSLQLSGKQRMSRPCLMGEKIWMAWKAKKVWKLQSAGNRQ